MLNNVLGLFTAFNPIVLVALLATGACLALRRRTVQFPAALFPGAGRDGAVRRR